MGLPEGLAEKLLRHTFYKWKPKSEPIYNSQDIPIIAETVIDNSINENIEKIDHDHKKEDSVASESANKFSKSEAYNGNIFDNYCWSQTITDVDITIKVPENFSKKKISVKILHSSISVKLDDGVSLLTGDLCNKCKANEAIWSVDKDKLQIHLDKCQETWWNCLVKSEPPLDISKIDCSRPYDELTEEAQAKIEELQWNQERKRLGLPTSSEIANHDTLKKAWNADGSPFTGPFDPSTVIFN